MLLHQAVQTWTTTTVQLVSQQVTHALMGNVQNIAQFPHEQGYDLRDQIEDFHDKNLC